MDQPPLAEPAVREPGASPFPLPVLPAGAAERRGGEACVVRVRSPGELRHWLRQDAAEVAWIQAEGLLGQPEAWIDAAREGNDVALDVVLSDPSEYPLLYRLVDVRHRRGVRVTIPVRPGFLKGLRLAAALHLPVRLLPAQPDEQELRELAEAVDFYLHDPMVDTPVEFFHSALGWSTGGSTTDLWLALERDPAVFPQFDDDGHPLLPADWPEASAGTFVRDHLDRLEQRHAECATCAWSGFCRGYFKLPDPGHSCVGIVGLLDRLGAAAAEIATGIGDTGPPVAAPVSMASSS